MAKKRNFNKPRRPKRATPAVRKAPRALVDIVMPIFGEWSMAEKAVDSIFSDAEGSGLLDDIRLILVDNGSPPFTMADGAVIPPEQAAGALQSKLRSEDMLVRLPQNIGFPGGVNAGVERGRSPLVFLISADIVLQEGCLANMIKELDNPDVGVVGIKLLFPPESPHGPPETVQHAGHAFSISGKIYHIFLGWSKDHPRVNMRREMSSVTGAVFGTRRNLWELVGGMDVAYGSGTYEDVDYCFKVRINGKKVVYTPEAVAYHYVGGSFNAGANKFAFPQDINERIFMGRWLQKGISWDEWRFY